MQVLDINNSMKDYGPYKEPIINIVGVGGEIRRITGFLPYFYVTFDDNYKDIIIDELQIRDIKYKFEEKYLPMYYQGKKTTVIKIIASDPKEIRSLRTDIKNISGIDTVFEADILFKNRFLIDKNIFGMGHIDDNNNPISVTVDDNIKVMGFDIEVLPPESLAMPVAENGDKIIVVSFAFSHKFAGYNSMVCIVGNGSNYEDVYFFPSERDLLYYFNEVFAEYDPDIICGYNINGFDFDYINKREMAHRLIPMIGRNKSRLFVREGFNGNLSVGIFGRCIMDLLPLVKANYNYPSYNLKTISHELLKNDKIDMPMWKMRQEYINGDYKNTVDYARKDATLMLELLNKTKFMDKYIAISKLTGLLLQDCVNSGQSQKIEMVLMREFKKENRLMAMKPYDTGDFNNDNTVKYGGATVFEPKIGLSKDIVVLDYKSLYPTIMISQNYSYDTIIREEDKYLCNSDDINKAVVGGWFIKPEIKMGIVPKILTELLNERIRIKKLMKAAVGSEKEFLDARQYALKILLNSFYGYSGYTRARLFEVGIAAAVTSFGRQNIEETRNFVETNYKQCKIIYGDTDSIFVEIKNDNYEYGEIPLDELKEIGVAIGNARSEQLPAPMELLYEKIAKRIIFEAKKKYVYLNFEQNKDGKWESKIKASGVETKRREWSKIVGKTLTKCIEEILLNNNTDAAIKVVKDAVNYIEQLEYHNPEDLDLLILTKKYQKRIEEYKVVPIQIKVAQKMIKNNEQLNLGDRISYLIVRGDGKYNERAQSVNEIIKSNLEIDRNYYINTQLIPPIERFFKCLNIKKELYYNGTINLKKDIIILKTNGKNVMQKNLFSYEG